MRCGGASSETFATRPLSMSSGTRFPGPSSAAGIPRLTLKCATRFASPEIPLVYIRYNDAKMLNLYQDTYQYKEFFNDRDLKVRLLSRSRPGPLH